MAMNHPENCVRCIVLFAMQGKVCRKKFTLAFLSMFIIESGGFLLVVHSWRVAVVFSVTKTADSTV